MPFEATLGLAQGFEDAPRIHFWSVCQVIRYTLEGLEISMLLLSGPSANFMGGLATTQALELRREQGVAPS